MFPQQKCPQCYYYLFFRDDGGLICGKCRWTPDNIEIGKRPITITKARQLGFKDGYFSGSMAAKDGYSTYEDYHGKHVKVTFVVEPGEDHATEWDDVLYVGLVKDRIDIDEMDPFANLEPNWDQWGDWAGIEYFPYPPDNGG